MNLFWKKLFGGLTSTSKLEKKEFELTQSMRRYTEVANSLELSEYKSLFHEVKSSGFIENKKTLQNRKYKDTEEYRNSKKLTKLENSVALNIYFQVLKSKILEQYLAFKASPEYEDLGDKKKIKASEKLQSLKNFERSKSYKSYCRFHDSYILKEYHDLKKLCATPEFKSKNAFWQNQNRWKTTPEFAKEKRFYELAKNPDILFYLNEKPERFNEYKKLKLSFSDEFQWNTLTNSRWDFGFKYKSAKLIGNHSYTNEKQAYNEGRNISVENGHLTLRTKHDKVKSKAWDHIHGFVEKEFDFSSDVIQTANEFRQKGGVFSAKLRCTGRINHAFWLGSDNKMTLINIFHFDGKHIKVGNINKNKFEGTTVRGISPLSYYIYSLKWTDKELIWMINNIEVYRTKNNIPNEAMYLVFNSFIPNKMTGSTGSLEVDWVRVYKID